MTEYTNLCFEGGGVLGLAYAGALRELEKHIPLSQFHNFAGSSAGSIAAGVLACGASVDYIERTMRNFDPAEFADDSWGILFDLYRLLRYFGWHRGDKLYQWMGKILEELTGGPDITFGQVYTKYGNSLIVTGSNLDKQTVIYFNKDDNRDMPIRDAIRISTSFPWYYQSVQYKGDIYVDGGLGNNFPMDAFYINGQPNPKTLGFKLETSDEINNKLTRVTNLKSHTGAIIGMIYNQAQRVHVRAADWPRTIKINVGNMKSMDLHISEEEQDFLIAQGEKSVQNFFQ